MRLEWSARAKNDVLSIADYIARDSSIHARRHVQRLVDHAKQLTQFPKSGRIVPEFLDENIREIILGNDRIVYQVNAKQKVVTVVTVFEAHMRLK